MITSGVATHPKKTQNRILAVAAAGVVAIAGYLLIATNAAQNPSADLNGDGQVGIIDLSVLLGKWGQSGAGINADLNADNTVSILDLSILLSQWGSAASVGTLCDGYSNWSDPATWGGSIPAANSSPTIPATKKVRMDVDPPALNTLSIPSGTELCIPDRNATLTAKVINVFGDFTAGTELRPFTSNLTIRLTGGNVSETIPFPGQAATTIAAYRNPLGDQLGSTTGTNVLLAANGGKINIHGKNVGRNWTKLAQSSPKGTNTVRLVDGVQWPVGSQLVIPSSDFDPMHYEEAAVTAISVDGKTLTLDKNLAYDHTVTVTSFSAGSETRSVEERTEIGLISHNITITGPENIATNEQLVATGSTATAFGGHTLVLPGGVMRMSNTRLTKMSQYDNTATTQGAILGRYPIHFHVVGDASASELKNISIDKSPNRFVTIHATDNLKISGMVAHDTIGHGIMFEDSNEKNNTIDDTLALTVRWQPVPAKRLLRSDNFPSEFWFTTVRNTITNSSAAGGNGPGFWWDFVCGTRTSSGDNKGVIAVACGGGPAEDPFGKAENLVAHSRTPDPRNNNDSHNENFACVDFSSYAVNTGCDSQAPGILVEQYFGDYNQRAQILNATAWKNSDVGIWSEGSADMVNPRTANNGQGMVHYNGATWGGLLVGETGNTRGENREDANGFQISNLWHSFHGSYDVDDFWFANYQHPGGHGNAVFDMDGGDTHYGTIRLRNLKFFGCGQAAPLTFAQDLACGGYRINSEHNTNNIGPLQTAQTHWLIDMDGSILGNGAQAFLYDNDPLSRIGDPNETTIYPNVPIQFASGKGIWGRKRPTVTAEAKFDTGPIKITDMSSGLSITDEDSTALKFGQPYYVENFNGGAYGGTFDFRFHANDPGYTEIQANMGFSPSAVKKNGDNTAKASSCSNLSSATPWCYNATTGRTHVRGYFTMTTPAMRQQVNNETQYWSIQQ
jgi:hypothetical protein